MGKMKRRQGSFFDLEGPFHNHHTYGASPDKRSKRILSVLGLIGLTLVLCVVVKSSIDYALPSEGTIVIQYRYGIEATVHYNRYNGIPHVDSTMTHELLCVEPHVDSVTWKVPPDARMYWAVSLHQIDPADADAFLASVFPSQ